MWVLCPQQEFRNNQENNKDGEHIDESAGMRDARKNGLTKETKQPLHGQDQDDEFKQGNPPSNNLGVPWSGFP